MSDCPHANGSVCSCGSFSHPLMIFNPPGQDFIAYRVGDYTAFRHALLQNLDGETELSSTSGGTTTQIWRPGGQGDLALQMMEWWAYLSDILTFYNERVATESYLRTADQSVSVNRLVRLLGYRPRPGIGATGTLAALASGPKPFTLPAGFAVQSKPGPGKEPQVFELAADTTVGAVPGGPGWAALSSGVVGARAGTDPTQLPINGNTITLAGTSSAVKKGDQVLIVPTTITASGPFALATVAKVTPVTDPTLGAMTSIDLTWQTAASAVSSLTNLQLLKGGQSTQVWQYPAGDGTVVRNAGSPKVGTIDLASIVRGIKANDPVLFQSSASAYGLFLVKSTSEVIWYANPKASDPSEAPTADKVIPIPIPHTSVTLTTALPTGSPNRVSQISSQATQFEASQFVSNAAANNAINPAPQVMTAFSLNLSINQTAVLNDNAAAILAALPTAAEGDTQAVRGNFAVWHSWVVVDDLIAIPAGTLGGPSTGSVITLSPVGGGSFPASAGGTPVLLEDSVGTGTTGVLDSASEVDLNPPVPLLIPPLNMYFNLLPVSRGKTVQSEVLGSGNAALSGQDFTLQNSPVTYLQNSASRSGDNYSSTVLVWVNGLQWTEVQSFFGQPSTAQVFITREDDSGQTHVVFGDGEFGARLPTGTDNVTASYRYGSGADAPAAGSLTVVLKPQPGLRSLRNPVAVGGGSDPDPPAKLRKYAPRSVLTFGRAVSGDDYQVIAAQAPGVIRAASAFAFDPVEQRPRVTVWVGDDDGAVSAARAAIAASADPNRLPAVLPAKKVQITLTLSLVVDPRRHADDVLAAVHTAILDPDDGLLGLNVLGIGQPIYDSQIFEACLAVPGVLAVRGLSLSSAGIHFFILIRRILGPNACSLHRHDPGAGAYFFLPDDGQSLTLSAEAP